MRQRQVVKRSLWTLPLKWASNKKELNNNRLLLKAKNAIWKTWQRVTKSPKLLPIPLESRLFSKCAQLYHRIITLHSERLLPWESQSLTLPAQTNCLCSKSHRLRLQLLRKVVKMQMEVLQEILLSWTSRECEIRASSNSLIITISSCGRHLVSCKCSRLLALEEVG